MRAVAMRPLRRLMTMPDFFRLSHGSAPSSATIYADTVCEARVVGPADSITPRGDKIPAVAEAPARIMVVNIMTDFLILQ